MGVLARESGESAGFSSCWRKGRWNDVKGFLTDGEDGVLVMSRVDAALV